MRTFRKRLREAMRKEAELVAKNMRLSEENDELHKKLRLVEHTNESKFLS